MSQTTEDVGNAFVGGFILGGMVGMALMILAGIFLATPAAISHEQQKAVDAGVGRWKVDAKTGDREFHYGTQRE